MKCDVIATGVIEEISGGEALISWDSETRDPLMLGPAPDAFNRVPVEQLTAEQDWFDGILDTIN